MRYLNPGQLRYILPAKSIAVRFRTVFSIAKNGYVLNSLLSTASPKIAQLQKESFRFGCLKKSLRAISQLGNLYCFICLTGQIGRLVRASLNFLKYSPDLDVLFSVVVVV